MPTVEIDGQQVDIEELKKGYMRDSDYRKKTMELAEEKKKLKPEPADSHEPVDLEKDVDTLVNMLAPKLHERFVSRQETDLEKFLQQNPDLESKRKLLEDLGKTSNKSYWDIAAEYDLKPSDALEKSKSRKIVGESKLEQKQGPKISDMSPDEWKAYKKEQLGIGSRQMWHAKNMS